MAQPYFYCFGATRETDSDKFFKQIFRCFRQMREEKWPLINSPGPHGRQLRYIW
ncbi:hypothetical protein [Rhodocytophaga aerolata]|uniref:hypothetical protein n=1 Tax=Rhodocytophaga aerolata TaxID=455078 RepID=UPI00366A9627